MGLQSNLHLAIFCINIFTNGVYWCTFAPISAQTGLVFNVSDSSVNVLSLLYLILYPLGSWLASELIEKKGLRSMMLWASTLDMVCGLVRVLALILLENTSIGKSAAFGILLVGQSFGALAQPLMINTVVRITVTWFKHHDGATVLGSMMNPLGNAAGQVIPVLMVDALGNGLLNLMYLQLAFSLVSFIAVVAYFQDAPAIPVSTLSESRERNLAKMTSGIVQSSLQSAQVMMQDSNFLKLFFGFGAGLGLFNAVTTLTAQLLLPLGMSSDDAGTAGALFIGCGLVLSGIYGYIMDKTHAYSFMFKVGGTLAAAFLVFFCFSLTPNNSTLVFIGFALLGAFTVPLLPVVFECSAACMYPLPEDVSNGLLVLSGQIFGIIDIVVLPILITKSGTNYSEGITFLTPLSIFLIVNAFIVISFAFWFNGEDKRKAAESLDESREDLISVTSKI